ncbi:MAG TPA: hypothetical protein P5042_06395, partial [Candidatus Izemoplasmatales bacterium]|nr:hypothetical protein [Candidatus Izemoplasmatales bacterium]
MEKPDPLFLRCPCLEKESMGSDISLLNDEIASYIGWFLSVADDLPQDLLEDIHRCQEYHMRLLAAVSEDDIIQESDLEWIMDKFARIKIQCQVPKGYVYPNGDESAAIMH